MFKAFFSASVMSTDINYMKTTKFKRTVYQKFGNMCLLIISVV